MSHLNCSPSSFQGTTTDPAAVAHPAHLGVQTTCTPRASSSPCTKTRWPRCHQALTHTRALHSTLVQGEGCPGKVMGTSEGPGPIWIQHCSQAEVKREGHGPMFWACGAQPSKPREAGAGSRMR